MTELCNIPPKSYYVRRMADDDYHVYEKASGYAERIVRFNTRDAAQLYASLANLIEEKAASKPEEIFPETTKRTVPTGSGPPMSSNSPPIETPTYWRSGSCSGETCALCGAPAAAKIGEEIMHDDPQPARHNLTAYVCERHFVAIFGRIGAHLLMRKPS